MKTFNNERGSGGYKGGGDRGGFAKKSWTNDRPAQLFKATCAECGKSCDVPFRPTGDKPVYCNNCFSKKRDGADDRGGRDYSAPKRDFGDRFSSRDSRPSYNDRSERPSFKPAVDNSKQLSEISMKLDRLIVAMEKMTAPKAPKAAPDLSDIAELAMFKTPKPKTSKKKTEAKPKSSSRPAGKKVSKKK